MNNILSFILLLLPHVFNLLASKLLEKMREQVILFLLGGEYSTSGDPTAAFQGHLYEGVMHKYRKTFIINHIHLVFRE